MTRRTTGAAILAAALFVCSAARVAAAEYPSHPVSLVVPFPPGGTNDGLARIISEKLSAALGEQVIVENRGGGGGTIGVRMVARAAPDGYTLLLGHTGTVAINPTLYANPGYQPKDFAPISLIAANPVVLMVHPSLPVHSVSDLIALARKEPGKLDLGVPSIGSGSHLSAELFKSMAGVDMTIVSYKGTAGLTTDLLGGHVPAAFNMIPPALGNIRAGTLRALAVAAPARSSLLPDVPTAQEAGLPGFVAVLHYGLLAPAGTPRAIVERLNAEVRALAATPEVRARIAADGGEPLTSTPEAYADDIDREEAKWGALVRKLGLHVE